MVEGSLPVIGGNIWYRIVGDHDAVPLLVIHGGPAYAHNYLEPLQDLSDTRQVVLYDQLGCGKSDRPEEPALWTIDRFRDELHQLVTHLGLEKTNILGHSWGGILAVEYCLAHPDTVESLVLASPCLSTKCWLVDANKLIGELSASVRRAIYSNQLTGTTDSEEYALATSEYERRYVCRLQPPPQPLLDSKVHMNEAIYRLMWGPSEFYLTGTLKGYDCTSRLGSLSCPVLFTCGRYDEATPESVVAYSRFIRTSAVIVFENSAHMPHLEETGSYLRVLREFLSRVERR